MDALAQQVSDGVAAERLVGAQVQGEVGCRGEQPPGSVPVGGDVQVAAEDVVADPERGRRLRIRSRTGPDGMRAQLVYLAKVAERPNVTLQVLGFECVATPATGAGSMTLFTMPDPEESAVLYLEQPDSGLFVQGDREKLDRYAEILDHVRVAALTPAESQTRLAAIASDLLQDPREH